MNEKSNLELRVEKMPIRPKGQSKRVTREFQNLFINSFHDNLSVSRGNHLLLIRSVMRSSRDRRMRHQGASSICARWIHGKELIKIGHQLRFSNEQDQVQLQGGQLRVRGLTFAQLSVLRFSLPWPIYYLINMIFPHKNLNYDSSIQIERVSPVDTNHPL